MGRTPNRSGVVHGRNTFTWIHVSRSRPDGIDEIRKCWAVQARADSRHAATSAHVGVASGRPDVLNMCANNYLGLADHPEVIKAAHEALDHWGYGMASVRFICGTQELHKQLERAISRVSRHGGHDPLLLVLRRQRRAVRDAAGAEDAIISDELNHASIIDGSPALQGPAASLQEQRHGRSGGEAAGSRSDARFRMIATDGVFSMDGIDRQPAGDLRPGRQVRRPGDGRRFACRRFHGHERAAARTSITA